MGVVGSDSFGLIEERLASATYAAFSEYKHSGDLKSEILQVSSSHGERQVDKFTRNMVPHILLRAKGSHRSTPMTFDKKVRVITIGRDASNQLVIDDNRVSRSHARIEYDESQCEYIDLGSSGGSRLNGKPVLRAKLMPGDVIHLGESVLIFQLKQRKQTIFNSIARLFSSKKEEP